MDEFLTLDELPTDLYASFSREPMIPLPGKYWLTVVDVDQEKKRAQMEFEVYQYTWTSKSLWPALTRRLGDDPEEWLNKDVLTYCIIGLWKKRQGEDGIHWYETTNPRLARLYCKGGYTAKLHVKKLLP